MAKIKVKPKEGVTVKDQYGRVINPSGQSVCDNFFIKRLIKEGSLIIVTKAPAKKTGNEKGGK